MKMENKPYTERQIIHNYTIWVMKLHYIGREVMSYLSKVEGIMRPTKEVIE